jgi:chromosome segregation ATPase
MYENEKLKSENFMLQDKLKSNEEKNQLIIKSKDEEINTLNEDIEFNKKNTSKKLEEKNKEINLLKDEIIKCNRDINNLIKKNDVFEKEDREMKEKNNILQTKLDKKTKELQDINDSAKKLIENKENLIKEYGDKIDELMADKNQLIEQNHELLDKVKNMNTSNLGDILGEEEENENNDNNGNNNNYENILLTSEIKALKEQLENQANDLVSLNAMEKEVSRLKLENEKLEADYKALKDQIKKNKYDTSNDNFMIYVKKQYENLRMSRKKRVSFSGLKEIP